MTLKWLYFKKREVREKVFDRPCFDPKQWWNWSELVRFRDKNLMEVVFALNRLEKNRFGHMNFVLIRFDFEYLNSFEDVLGLNITLLRFLRCFWGFLFSKNKLKNMFFWGKQFQTKFSITKWSSENSTKDEMSCSTIDNASFTKKKR
jgi:hypothetical protein